MIGSPCQRSSDGMDIVEESNIRKVFLPKTVAKMPAMTQRKKLEIMNVLGNEYSAIYRFLY